MKKMSKRQRKAYMRSPEVVEVMHEIKVILLIAFVLILFVLAALWVGSMDFHNLGGVR